MLPIHIALENVKKLKLDQNEEFNHHVLYVNKYLEVIALTQSNKKKERKGMIVYSKDENTIGKEDIFNVSEMVVVYNRFNKLD